MMNAVTTEFSTFCRWIYTEQMEYHLMQSMKIVEKIEPHTQMKIDVTSFLTTK